MSDGTQSCGWPYCAMTGLLLSKVYIIYLLVHSTRQIRALCSLCSGAPRARLLSGAYRTAAICLLLALLAPAGALMYVPMAAGSLAGLIASGIEWREKRRKTG